MVDMMFSQYYTMSNSLDLCDCKLALNLAFNFKLIHFLGILSWSIGQMKKKLRHGDGKSLRIHPLGSNKCLHKDFHASGMALGMQKKKKREHAKQKHSQSSCTLGMEEVDNLRLVNFILAFHPKSWNSDRILFIILLHRTKMNHKNKREFFIFVRAVDYAWVDSIAECLNRGV